MEAEESGELPAEEIAKLGDPLTEEEIDEKKKLLDESFTDWNRRDFQLFVRGCEMFGRNDIHNIATLLTSRHNEQEVREYAETLWRRYEEFPGSRKRDE